MPRVQLPATTPKRRAWNKGRIIGQKRPLLPKQVWAIRARLELAMAGAIAVVTMGFGTAGLTSLVAISSVAARNVAALSIETSQRLSIVMPEI